MTVLIIMLLHLFQRVRRTILIMVTVTILTLHRSYPPFPLLRGGGIFLPRHVSREKRLTYPLLWGERKLTPSVHQKARHSLAIRPVLSHSQWSNRLRVTKQVFTYLCLISSGPWTYVHATVISTTVPGAHPALLKHMTQYGLQANLIMRNAVSLFPLI